VSHDEKRVESECGIDHKLLLRQTESSQSERGNDQRLLLRPKETTNHSDALITSFFNAEPVNQSAALINIFSCDTEKQPITATH
jgi:hypothetical protein